MKFNEWEPLTNEQVQQINKWDESPDPCERLFTQYYTWSRHQLLDDYSTEIAAGGYDMCEKDEAWQSLERKLKKLRDDYVRDLMLFVEMQQTMAGTYCPVRFKLLFKDDGEKKDNEEKKD